jgi:hypothetical protein
VRVNEHLTLSAAVGASVLQELLGLGIRDYVSVAAERAEDAAHGGSQVMAVVMAVMASWC